jgi:hypothetical protein
MLEVPVIPIKYIFEVTSTAAPIAHNTFHHPMTTVSPQKGLFNALHGKNSPSDTHETLIPKGCRRSTSAHAAAQRLTTLENRILPVFITTGLMMCISVSPCPTQCRQKTLKVVGLLKDASN